MKLKKEILRWLCGQEKITSRCAHVLGFVYGKQEEMPARVAVPSSCHRARGTASLCMNPRCVLQEDSSENDEVLKSTLFFPCGKIFGAIAEYPASLATRRSRLRVYAATPS